MKTEQEVRDELARHQQSLTNHERDGRFPDAKNQFAGIVYALQWVLGEGK